MVLAVTAALLSLAVSRADAADITPRATVSVALDTSGVSTSAAGQPVYWDWEKAAMKVTWAVPNGSAPGDYFTVPLDAQLAPSGFVPFDVLAPDGSVVARATIVGGVVRFTLTDDGPPHGRRLAAGATLRFTVVTRTASGARGTVPNLATARATGVARVTARAPA